MDNDNQKPITNAQPIQPSASSEPSVPQATVSEASGDSNKMILYLIIGLVIVVALVGGIYFFLSKQQTAIETNTNQPVAQVSPTPQDTVDALDRDLSALNIGTADSDFSSVDSDLEQL